MHINSEDTSVAVYQGKQLSDMLCTKFLIRLLSIYRSSFLLSTLRVFPVRHSGMYMYSYSSQQQSKATGERYLDYANQARAFSLLASWIYKSVPKGQHIATAWKKGGSPSLWSGSPLLPDFHRVCLGITGDGKASFPNPLQLLSSSSKWVKSKG